MPPPYQWEPPPPRPVRRRPPSPPSTRLSNLLRRRWLRVAAGALALVCGLLGVLVAYAELTLPPLGDIGRATGTIRILDRQGRLIAEIDQHARDRRTVPLAQVSPLLVKATVSTEDRDFYDEGALNLGRIAKALLVDVVARHPTQGASTITQQLAKLAFLSPEKSGLRKLREALLASEIDRAYSKDQILEKYLNLVDYGAGATGCESAAQRYFGKHAMALDLREASLLAGLPQAPSFYNPYENPAAAFGRQHTVLRSMVASRTITKAQADAVDAMGADATSSRANQQALLAELRNGLPLRSGSAPHFAEYVREQVETELGGDPQLADELHTQNLSVDTTLDLDVQRHAQRAVSDGVGAIARGANNGALIMLDAHNGDILAMVGSANFDDAAIDGQFNATTGLRRPGSSFKPYVYAEAFREGRLSPTSIVDDTAAESARLGGVQDFDRTFLGRISVTRAIVQSRNVPAEEAMNLVGNANVAALAHAMGIGTPIAPDLTAAIGTSAVRMTDHAAAYAALANGGTRVRQRAVLRIHDSRGQLLFDAAARPTAPRVLSQQVTADINGILRGQPRTFNLGFRYDVAAKSGTTDDFVDAWYMTYSPDWVVAAWVAHTGEPREVGMDNVDGLDVGRQISVPFVNGLPPPHGFAGGVPGDCGAAGCNGNGNGNGNGEHGRGNGNGNG